MYSDLAALVLLAVKDGKRVTYCDDNRVVAARLDEGEETLYLRLENGRDVPIFNVGDFGDAIKIGRRYVSTVHRLKNDRFGDGG